jgi:D-arginine dehydrogenase
LATLRATGTAIEVLDAPQALARMPLLKGEGLLGGLYEPDAMDIDVHALHQGFLRGARRQGAQLWCDARLESARYENGVWQLTLADGRSARAGVLVNAAGAWADEVAAVAGAQRRGLQPKRRSAFTFGVPPGIDARDWPAVAAIDERWYLKPDAGQLLGSPANADPVPPHDVQPEELDIATGIAAIEEATALTIRRPSRSWAGLRTFAPDGDLVIGFDPGCAGFFWLAGQGGYGIQSAAGASLLAAQRLLDQALDPGLLREGVQAALLSPARVGLAAHG